MAKGADYSFLKPMLGPAEHALKSSATFGQVLDIKLPHKDRNYPKGYPVRVMIAVGPNKLVCRVFNRENDHNVFREVTESLLEHAAKLMNGWRSKTNSYGSATRSYWRDITFWPTRHTYHKNLLMADLLHAIHEATVASIRNESFKRTKRERWQSENMENGIYQVEWTVQRDKNTVNIKIRNKDKDKENYAFRALIPWVFEYIEYHSPDKIKVDTRTYGFATKVFSDSMRLEVRTLE